MFQRAIVVVLFAGALLTSETAYGQERYGVALFNMAGVRGIIRFIPEANNSMRVMVELSGLMGGQVWHVHTHPIDLTLAQKSRCSNDNIGGHYDPLDAIGTLGNQYMTYCSPSNQSACEVGDLGGKLGNIPANGMLNRVDTTGMLSLFGRYGIIGRSVKIHLVNNHHQDACATIRLNTELDPSTPVTTLAATFISPVAGTIYLRQIANEDVAIFGKIFWVNSEASTTGHNWHIHQNLPNVYYRSATCTEVVGPHYNPFRVNTSDPSYSTNCGPMTPSNCEVGDLSNKHARIDIPGNPSPFSRNAFFYTDTFLNLSTVVDRSIAIHEANRGGPIIACAPLVRVESLTVQDVLRDFTAQQPNQFSNTTVTTDLTASNLLLLSSVIAPNQLCNTELSRGSAAVFNPYSSPDLDGSSDTPDRYRVGDIARKYNFRIENRIMEFPVYGTDTVAVRTLADSGNGYTCSTLWPYFPSGSNVQMAKATFSGTVEGAIFFVQRKYSEAVFGNTYIIVDIWFSASDRTNSSGHNWHIHVNPPMAGMTCTQAIGGHFNPFNVQLMGNYSTYCSRQTPLRCESGDLGSKHGRLAISQPSPYRVTYSYVDNNLNLFGPTNYSIIGRSVGLHDITAGAPLFDCAEIRLVQVASEMLQLQFRASNTFNRVNFARDLTRNTGVSSSDLLMLRQEIMNRTLQSRTVQCVNMTVRVLGASAEQAGNNMMAVQRQFNELYRGDPCSGCILAPSLLILLCLILTTLI